MSLFSSKCLPDGKIAVMLGDEQVGLFEFHSDNSVRVTMYFPALEKGIGLGPTVAVEVNKLVELTEKRGWATSVSAPN